MTNKEINRLALLLIKQATCDHSGGRVYGFKTTCISCGKVLKEVWGRRR